MISENMQYRRLPGTEMDVSVVSIGSLGFSRAGVDADGIAAIVNRALDLGVNFIDTAYAYGEGDIEKAIGPVLEKRRDECFVLTRSHEREPDEFKRTMAGCFDRLRTDYIEIFEPHDVSSFEDYEKLTRNGVFDMVAEKVAEGKIGYAAISTHGPLDLVKEIVTSGRFSVITVAYNLTGRKRSLDDGEFMGDTADVILPLAHQHGVGVTVMKPFGGGRLLREAPDGTRLSPVKCLLYILANPYVATASPGVESLAQLEEDVGAGRPGMALSDEEKAELEELGRQWGMYFCRQCGYCLPCSEDIDIPKVMDLLESRRAAQDDPEKISSIRNSYRELQVNASDCVECGDCEERCPYDLPIIERMKESVELMEA